VKKIAVLLGALMIASLMPIAPAGAQAESQPFVRVTYICQAPEAGITTGGVEVEAGDHIYRIRYEAENSGAQAPDTVSYSTNFLSLTGEIDKGETIFRTSAVGANGVKVVTDPANLSNGTASVSGAVCTMQPPPPAQPADADDCKDGGWEDFGFRNQGQCIRFVNTGEDSR
jgi:hypothetical protein